MNPRVDAGKHGNLVSARTPADLPVFVKGMVDWRKSR